MNRGVSLKQISSLPLKAEIARMKEIDDVGHIRELAEKVRAQIAALEVER